MKWHTFLIILSSLIILVSGDYIPPGFPGPHNYKGRPQRILHGYDDSKPDYEPIRLPPPGYEAPREPYNSPNLRYDSSKEIYNSPHPGYESSKETYNSPRPGYDNPKYMQPGYNNDSKQTYGEYAGSKECNCVRWTNWISADTPSDSGDYETLGPPDAKGKVGTIHHVRPDVCTLPLRMECRTLHDATPWYLAYEHITEKCTPHGKGFSCENKKQIHGKCKDYEVRLLCFYSTGYDCPCLYWTEWYDTYDPIGKGDEELIGKQLPKYVCEHGFQPVDVQCETVLGLDVYHAGNKNVKCDLEGLSCYNEDQGRNCKCHDYRVRFLCPKFPSNYPIPEYDFNSNKTYGSGDYGSGQYDGGPQYEKEKYLSPQYNAKGDYKEKESYSSNDGYRKPYEKRPSYDQERPYLPNNNRVYDEKPKYEQPPPVQPPPIRQPPPPYQEYRNPSGDYPTNLRPSEPYVESEKSYPKNDYIETKVPESAPTSGDYSIGKHETNDGSNIEYDGSKEDENYNGNYGVDGDSYTTSAYLNNEYKEEKPDGYSDGLVYEDTKDGNDYDSSKLTDGSNEYNGENEKYEVDQKPYDIPEISYDGQEKPYDGSEKPYDGPDKPYDGQGKPYDHPEKPYESPGKPYDGPENPYDGPEKPYDGSEKPYDGSEKPYDGPEKPYDGPEKPYDGPQKPYDGPEKPYDGPEKPYDGPEKPYDGPEKPYDGPEKPYDGPEKPYDGPEKPYDGPEKPYDGPEKPYDGPEKPYDDPEKPYDDPEKPYYGPEKPYDGPEKPYDGPEKPYDGPEKPYDGPGKPYDGPEKPYDGPEKLYDGPEKPYDGPEKPYEGSRRIYDGAERPYNEKDTRFYPHIGSYEDDKRYQEQKIPSKPHYGQTSDYDGDQRYQRPGPFSRPYNGSTHYNASYDHSSSRHPNENYDREQHGSYNEQYRPPQAYDRSSYGGEGSVSGDYAKAGKGYGDNRGGYGNDSGEYGGRYGGGYGSGGSVSGDYAKAGKGYGDNRGGYGNNRGEYGGGGYKEHGGRQYPYKNPKKYSASAIISKASFREGHSGSAVNFKTDFVNKPRQYEQSEPGYQPNYYKERPYPN